VRDPANEAGDRSRGKGQGRKAGAVGEDSDVDLLVILPFEGQAIRKSTEILRKIQPRIPVDLIVRTPDYVRERLKWNDFFLREIIERGKTLYESSHH